jgi:hypothetical protein
MTEPANSNDTTFSSLIESEQAIERQLAAERIRARLWLESKKVEIERNICLELSHLEENHKNALIVGKIEAMRKVEAMVGDASTMARRMSGIDMAALRPIIRQHMAIIDPRMQHDRPDVQN